MITPEMLAQMLQQQAMPPINGVPGGSGPTAWSALARRAPVQPQMPMAGAYSQLAQRMAGQSPVTALPGAYAQQSPQMPPQQTPQIQNPRPVGGVMAQGLPQGGMQGLPQGLGSISDLLRLMHGGMR